MAMQTLHQGLEGDPAAWTVAQVLVHGDPGFQRQRKVLWKDAHKRLVAAGDCRLANTDSGTRSDQRQLSEVAVRAHREDAVEAILVGLGCLAASSSEARVLDHVTADLRCDHGSPTAHVGVVGDLSWSIRSMPIP
jgi:hypothetical protein